MKPIISIIAALDSKGGIGRDNKLPWHLKEDLRRFKELTMGHPVIMGRRTFESILDYLGKPLPGRTNIVITRNPVYEHGGAIIAKSIEEAIVEAKKLDKEEIFIIGGATIFEQALPITNTLYLTLVGGSHHCDTFFPDYSQFKTEIFKEEHLDSNPPYTWLTLKKDGS